MSYRSKFPIFKHHPDLVYLDTASTSQKPASVLKAERDFYEKNYANVHRGIYGLAVSATNLYEGTREKVRQFLNAQSHKEIIFTSGTTEGVNVVAHSFVAPMLNEGNNIIISAMEHHANLIPWQQLCIEKKAELRVIPISTEGVLDLAQYGTLLSEKTKIVAISHISNTLGTVNPIEKIIFKAHQHGVPVLVDVAQSIVSHSIDVQALDIDFLVFSGHKIFAPTGVGVLYGKEKFLNNMIPYKTGGSMIRDVTFEKTVFAPPPSRFEAGTPHIAGVIGLCAAIDFVEKIGRQTIKKHIQKLTDYATEKLKNIDGLTIIGNAPEKSGIISFVLKDIHPHDVTTILASQNIAIRAGHHCTQPIMDFYDIAGTNRVSFSIYNTVEDIDKLVEGIEKVLEILRG